MYIHTLYIHCTYTHKLRDTHTYTISQSIGSLTCSRNLLHISSFIIYIFIYYILYTHTHTHILVESVRYRFICEEKLKTIVTKVISTYYFTYKKSAGRQSKALLAASWSLGTQAPSALLLHHLYQSHHLVIQDGHLNSSSIMHLLGNRKEKVEEVWSPSFLKRMFSTIIFKF